MSETKYFKRIETCPAEGVFFQESDVIANDFPESIEWGIVNIYDDVIYQEILGFGGAFTESSAYVFSLLDEEKKKRFLKLYFDRADGIGYNFGRTHINSCDFSLDTYSSVADGDKLLDTFSLKRERKYIIPFIKNAMEYCPEEIYLFASPWSPPAYMKDNNNMLHGGRLLDEYKSIWADYYVRYIKEMAKENIRIRCVTVQNEPAAVQTWESCNYSAEEEQEFIDKYLIHSLDSAGLADIGIMIWDHNKEKVYDRAKKILGNKKIADRVSAVAHHWYSGDHFEGPRLVWEQLHKPLVCSEFCGAITDDVNLLAERYGVEICENLNNFVIASCDWNLLLDQKGGPYHDRTAKTEGGLLEAKDDGCFAPILYDTSENELIVTPIYYYIGHFSKYIRRGAKRVATTKHSKYLYVCAFVNPDGSKVCVILNTADTELYSTLRYRGGCTSNIMKPHSITTFLF